jgi:hypothetical protein
MNLQYFFADFPCSGLLGPHIPEMLVNWYAKKSGDMVNSIVSLFIPIYSDKKGIFRLP